MYVCQAVLPFVVVLGAQPGLTANLQGFRIRAPEGWPLLQSRPQHSIYGVEWVRTVTESDTNKLQSGRGHLSLSVVLLKKMRTDC